MGQLMLLLEQELNMVDRVTVSAFMLLFALAGCGLIYWTFREKKKVENMEEITAVCVKLVRSGRDHWHGRSFGRKRSNTPTYYPIFEYTYAGVTYTEGDAFHISTNVGLPRVGEECTVRIDSEHPEKPYYLNRKSHLVLIFIGVVLIVFSLYVIITFNI